MDATDLKLVACIFPFHFAGYWYTGCAKANEVICFEMLNLNYLMIFSVFLLSYHKDIHPRRVSNIDSVKPNKTYLNNFEILNKLFKEMNNIKIQNLIATPTWKKSVAPAFFS